MEHFLHIRMSSPSLEGSSGSRRPTTPAMAPRPPSVSNDLLEVEWTDHKVIFSQAVSKLRSQVIYKYIYLKVLIRQ